MAQTDRGPRDVRDELYGVMGSDESFEEKARQALEIGREYLGVDNGHLTQIDTEVRHWKAISSTDPPDGRFPPGLELDLDITYCRRTIEAAEPITLHDAPAQGWADDPAFQAHGLHCYHGTTLRIDDEPSGTLCFVATGSREEPFSDEETMFVELATRMLERERERERHEAELTRQANLVNVLNRVLRHNLRNEMSIVRGRARLMMEQPDVETHGDECLRAIDELLELSQKARELDRVVGESLDRQQTDMVALVDRVVDTLAPEYPDTSFTVEHEREVTAAVRPSFERAIEEVVENAAKHGREAPSVTITVETVPNAVEVRIADDGPGLDESERKVLDSGVETPLIHGSGLGLWLVHWIVSSHDGSIETDSTVDGTTLTLSVPRSLKEDTRQRVAKLRDARDRYQAAFEGAFDSMIIVDDDARIVDANPEASTIYGPDRRDLLGRSLEEFLPGGFAFEAAWSEFKKAGGERDIVTVVGADGVQRHVEYSATADIVPDQHLVVGRDVTERVEREQDLLEAETIFDQAQDAMFLIDVTEDGFRVRRVNETYERLTGISNDEIQGKTPREVVGDEVGAEIETRYNECLDKRTTIRYEVHIPVDGESRTWETKLSPVIVDGTIQSLVGAMRDVTDRKERERQLRQEREQFERLLETTPVGITILDETGRIVRANDRAEDILGLARSDITNREYDDLEWEIVDADGEPIPSEDLPFQRVLETGKAVYEYEHGISLADGTVRWLSINAAPLTTSEGEIERVIAVVTDRADQHADERIFPR